MDKEKNKNISILGMVIVVEGILLLVSVLWILIRKIPVFGHIHISFGSFSVGIIAAIGLLISSGIFYLIDKIAFGSVTRRMMELYVYPFFYNVKFTQIIIIALMSGFCEELFFRGILLAEFGIVISSVIFGILHTPGKKTWFLGAWTAFVGFLLAILYKVTGNLFIPMVAHFLNNLIAISYIRYYAPRKSSIQEEIVLEKEEINKEKREQDDKKESEVVNCPVRILKPEMIESAENSIKKEIKKNVLGTQIKDPRKADDTDEDGIGVINITQ